MRNWIVLGAAAILAVAALASSTIGDIHTAKYKGAQLCLMCHTARNKPIVEGYKKSAHAKALVKVDTPDAIVADFATNKAFTKDKVAYVLAVGRNEQDYLDSKLQLLPAAWDVKAKAWKPVEPVDAAGKCIACHTTGYEAKDNSYTQIGVGCEACHGPGGDHTGAPSKATIFNPSTLKGAQQAMICGQCHSVGKDPSGKYPFPVGYRPGDDLSKFFVDAKPTTAGRNQQYSEFIQSNHAGAGYSCTTCHDPHNTSSNPAQLLKPVNDLCLGCHAAKVKDMASHAPGAPAGATCATCHMPEGRHIFAKPGG